MAYGRYSYGGLAHVTPDGLTIGGGHEASILWVKPFLGDRYRMQFEVRLKEPGLVTWIVGGPGYGNSLDGGYACRIDKDKLSISREGVNKQIFTVTSMMPNEWAKVQTDVNHGSIVITINETVVAEYADPQPLAGPLHGWAGLSITDGVYRDLRIWSPTTERDRERQLIPPVTEKPRANGQLLYDWKLAEKERSADWWFSQPKNVAFENGRMVLSGTNGTPEVILTKPLAGNLACDVEFEYASLPHEAVEFSVLFWHAKEAPKSSKECEGSWLVFLPSGDGKSSIHWHRGPEESGEGVWTGAPRLASTPYYVPLYQQKSTARIESHGDGIRVFLNGGLILASRIPEGSAMPTTPIFLGLRQRYGGSTVHTLRVYQLSDSTP